MTEYIRVLETSSVDESNRYIKNGWDLIDTSKVVDDIYGGSKLTYILGLSLKEYANELLAIIKEYEASGFKEDLFKKFAEETGDKPDDYETIGHAASNSLLANFMSAYEDVVNNKKVTYFNKSANAKFYPEYDPESDEF